MIILKQKTKFKKTLHYLDRCDRALSKELLQSIGEEGVTSLSVNTPTNTGKTANSWYYKINNKKNRKKITFCNRNMADRVSVATLIQYGHVTKDGRWVPGQDYINPALKPVFNDGVKKIRRNITHK